MKRRIIRSGCGIVVAVLALSTAPCQPGIGWLQPPHARAQSGEVIIPVAFHVISAGINREQSVRISVALLSDAHRLEPLSFRCGFLIKTELSSFNQKTNKCHRENSAIKIFFEET